MDSSSWKDVPKKDEPVGNEILNAEEGYIHRVNIQGMLFSGDHIAVIDSPSLNGCQVYIWDDDLQDGTQPNGAVFTFRPLTRAEGFWNTDITKDTYDPSLFASFPYPDVTLTRHGIWMPDSLAYALDAYEPHGWDHWIDEL